MIPLRLIPCLLTAGSLSAAGSLQSWWAEHGDFTLRNLAFVQLQEPAHIPLFDSLAEPENPLDLPELSWVNEFRPEASLSFEHLFLSVDPRFTARRDEYGSGALDGRHRDDSELFLQEWTVQLLPTPELSLAYARKDLQWGPAFLLSPSNPFDSRNGRDDPTDEVPAGDFLKAVWTPNFNWSFTAIANLDDGRKDYRLRSELRQDFRDIYALKADYLFDRGNAALVASTMDDAEDEDRRVGAYLSYNLTDAGIAYAEGSLSTEDEELLLGGSYSVQGGPTVALEYFHNSSGIDDPIPEDPADLVAFEDFVLDLPNRESFFRENYLLLQLYQNDVVGGLDYILRYTHNLDDSSRSLLGHLELDLNDYASLFTTATLNSSGGGELDSLREHWIKLGIELVF